MQQQSSFLGHPRGLATLFFTEFWERFSYYGMRGILVLFMTATVASGGLGFDTKTAGSIYGLYTSLVYAVGIPGGWIADKILGARRSVLYGGIIIMLGHFAMGVPNINFFFLGLLLIIIGTGLLKPNISVMVGQLYADDEAAKRDAGFSIFYLGINMGAFFSPLVCGYLGENVDWHVGFAAAGVGMAFGLVQYVLGAKHLPPLIPIEDSPQTAHYRKLALIGLGVFLAVVLGVAFGIQSSLIDLKMVTTVFGIAIVLLPIVFFASVLSAKDIEPVERKRFIAIIVFFVFSIFFWSAFEQAGSSLTIFARDYTDRFFLGIELPASFFQSLNPLYIIILTPVFAMFWLNIGKQMLSPVKFSLGLVILGMGFMVLAAGSFFISVSTPQISPMWLVVTYLFHTVGELFLSPVGLSLTTKLAPAKYASQSMGVWFLSSAVANFIGGEIAGYIADLVLWQLFGVIAMTGLVSGIVLFFVRKSIQDLMGGIR